MGTSFVFYDPTGRRWSRFRRGFGIAGVLAAVLLLVLALSIFSNAQLPPLGLPQVQHLANFGEVQAIIRGEKAVRNVPYRTHATIKYIRNGGNPVIHPRTAPLPHEGQPLVFGFYVNWDEASMTSLRLHLSQLTHLVPEWLVLENGKGDVSDNTDQTVVQIAADAHLPVLAEINNYRDGWQAGDLHRVLNSMEARANLVDNIYSNLQEHKFAGVCVDFEELKAPDRVAMIRFMEELRAKLKPAGLLIAQAAPIDDDNYDLKRLGEIDDFLIPMVYDEHYQSSAPGPVASEGWFYAQLGKLAKMVPKEKTVVGFGAYGYDWVIGAKGGTEVKFSDTIAAAEANKSKIVWDVDSENPVLRYTAGSDQHEVWFLDATTALNQITDAADAEFRGVAVWRLGAEDPGVWTILQQTRWPDDSFNPGPLFKLTSASSPNRYGTGEVLRIVDTPHDGRRNVWMDKDSGDFYEEYQSYPSYYVIERSGGVSNKMIGLTFDDGPSPEYTPRVLDVLAANHVPATFFVVGVNAEENGDLIRREYREGHTIGNHSYDHPNIARQSPETVRIELSTTLRILERELGHGTILFRPPYNADSEPTTPEEIVPIEEAQQEGYVTIAESIDPRDWEHGRTAEQIVTEVVNELEESADEGESNHLILLHDAGGNRDATLQALPTLIETLRGKGYRFVALEDIMGRTRAEVMPEPSAKEMRMAEIEGGALITKGNFKKVVGLLFLVAIYLTLLRSLVYGALAVLQKFKARRRRFDDGFHPPVSVIIAAFNEEKVIERTVRSVLENGYGDIEVVVVDDGSKDRTLAVLHELFDGDARVMILSQANAGKSAALNRGIAQARNNILVALDADTIFREGTIGKLVRHFSDERVGAVSGNARVGNKHTLITRFQSVEYIMGFNLDRRALDFLNAITVVPGAAGAWRKDLIVRLGGFGHDTLAEDTDLTLSIRRLGFEIRYDEEAIAWTEAPETTSGLAKQRFRWAFGTLQAVWKHRDATFNPAYGFLGMLALPSIWIFQVLLAALSPFAEVAMFIALFAGNWRIVLLYYLALFVVELLTALLAYALEGEAPWDLALLFPQRIYYRQLMYYVLGKSILYAMRGRLVGWGKLERTASVRP
jgi:cellulose synthase/poly-beta-1,6-N-acetylglucosamine synthase-like glycosyltransferase/spore germination protein YaaH/peptidoglycan/xylan/chitin deacetylase (PgdA/CDA1 family)